MLKGRGDLAEFMSLPPLPQYRLVNGWAAGLN